MRTKLLPVILGTWLGLWMGFFTMGCGSGGGDDETVVLAPTPTPAPSVDSHDCAVEINGGISICLAGDCNNTVPIDEPVIEEVVDETDIGGSLVKLLVHGKVEGVNINLNFCSQQHTEQSDSTSFVVNPTPAAVP